MAKITKELIKLVQEELKKRYSFNIENESTRDLVSSLKVLSEIDRAVQTEKLNKIKEKQLTAALENVRAVKGVGSEDLELSTEAFTAWRLETTLKDIERQKCQN